MSRPDFRRFQKPERLGTADRVTLVSGVRVGGVPVGGGTPRLGYMFIKGTVVHAGPVYNLIGVGSMSGGGGIRTHE